MRALTKIAWGVALTAMLLAGLLVSAQDDKAPAEGKKAGVATGPAQAGAQNAVAVTHASKNKARAHSPLYEEKGSGNNPMYENQDSNQRAKAPSGSGAKDRQGPKSSGDRAANKKGATATPQLRGNHKDVIEYKDGEDGVTHSRPGTRK